MLLGPWLNIYAQEPDTFDALERINYTRMEFDHVFDLGSPSGQTMLQDNDGFLWVGTEGGGIFRYDGYDLRNYGAGTGLLSNGTVRKIVQDIENPDIFWIATSGGLNRFDKETETFTYFTHDPDNTQSLGHNAVNEIVQDGNDANILWLGTAKGATGTTGGSRHRAGAGGRWRCPAAAGGAREPARQCLEIQRKTAKPG